MASGIARKPLFSVNENSGVHKKHSSFGEIGKKSKNPPKKSGVGFGNRKALKDITNRGTTRQEVSKGKPTKTEDTLEIGDEGFTHDHSKCIEAKEAARNAFSLHLVLPGYDQVTEQTSKLEPVEEDKFGMGSMDINELLVSNTSELFQYSKWVSPPLSPTFLDASSSPVMLEVDAVEFQLKEDDDDEEL